MSLNKENIFFPQQAEIIETKWLNPTEKHFVLKLKNNEVFDFQPGQIVEAGLPGWGEIPLGLSSSPVNQDSFELVVRKVGKVSTALVELNPGEVMYIRGPLGNGFPVEEFTGHPVLIVAGGIGLCPTRSMINYILDKRDDFKKFTLFFGSRDIDCRLFTDDLCKWEQDENVDFYETMDNPPESWDKNKGVITTLFAKTSIDPDTRVIICGPPVMYKFVIKELRKIGIPDEHVFVDLERRMKCGVGKCGHCQINNKYVCIDGPVFRYSDILGLEEAI
ncbi:MAG: hypothetical protein APR63_08075 [Desulfuromonas sp. SDB]|nr:MAG: hypothetical protein APR63_08075 [Desulfuromonas sp. SDB]